MAMFAGLDAGLSRRAVWINQTKLKRMIFQWGAVHKAEAADFSVSIVSTLEVRSRAPELNALLMGCLL